MLVVAVAGEACLLAQATRGEVDWTGFRGSAGNGVAENAELPIRWGPREGLRWKTQLPGTGWSQPIVWGNRIFVTTAETEQQQKPRPGDWGPGFSLFGGLGRRVFAPGNANGGEQPRLEQEPPADRAVDQPDSQAGRSIFGGLPFGGLGGGKPPDVSYQWKVLCLDAATGDIVWQQTAQQGQPRIPTHPNNTYASETPATDGQRLVAYFGMTGVYGFDLAGKLLWNKDLEAYPMQFGWGTGSSPVLDGDRVFIQCDNDKASFLVALATTPGDELWRVARDERSNWSTPYVWRNTLRTKWSRLAGPRYGRTVSKVVICCGK